MSAEFPSKVEEMFHKAGREIKAALIDEAKRLWEREFPCCVYFVRHGDSFIRLNAPGIELRGPEFKDQRPIWLPEGLHIFKMHYQAAGGTLPLLGTGEPCNAAIYCAVGMDVLAALRSTSQERRIECNVG